MKLKLSLLLLALVLSANYTKAQHSMVFSGGAATDDYANAIMKSLIPKSKE